MEPLQGTLSIDCSSTPDYTTKDYPVEPLFLGKHIRRRRLDLGLLQIEVAAPRADPCRMDGPAACTGLIDRYSAETVS